MKSPLLVAAILLYGSLISSVWAESGLLEYQPRHHRGEVLVESLEKLFPDAQAASLGGRVFVDREETLKILQELDLPRAEFYGYIRKLEAESRWRGGWSASQSLESRQDFRVLESEPFLYQSSRKVLVQSGFFSIAEREELEGMELRFSDMSETAELTVCLRFDASSEYHRNYCSTQRIPLKETVSLFIYQDEERRASREGILLGQGNLRIGIGLPGSERSRSLLEAQVWVDRRTY